MGAGFATDPVPGMTALSGLKRPLWIPIWLPAPATKTQLHVLFAAAAYRTFANTVLLACAMSFRDQRKYACSKAAWQTSATKFNIAQFGKKSSA